MATINISVKKVIVLVVLNLFIMVFLLSLLLSNLLKNKLLEKHNKELQAKVDDCHMDSANTIIEKEILYTQIDGLRTTMDRQTRLIITLTKDITELRTSPIIVRAIPCDDALEDFVSPKDNTASRGF